MKNIRAIVLRTAGTNCDKETVFALLTAGADVDLVHTNEIVRGEKKLDNYHLMAIPGGFSFGDDISAGKILANEMVYKFSEQMDKFVADGKLIIGICNGFQVLVKTGLLPGLNAKAGSSGITKQKVTVFDNDSGKFECRWIHLKHSENSKCIFTKGIERVIYLPVAHGEGKLIFDNQSTREKLWKNNQVVFQYCDEKGNSGPYPVNPNGSEDDIAGICNSTGRVFGLMPHPERNIMKYHHPQWTRNEIGGNHSDGFLIFKNACDFARSEIV